MLNTTTIFAICVFFLLLLILLIFLKIKCKKKSYISEDIITSNNNFNPRVKTGNKSDYNKELNGNLNLIIKDDLQKENNIRIESEVMTPLNKKTNKKSIDIIDKNKTLNNQNLFLQTKKINPDFDKLQTNLIKELSVGENERNLNEYFKNETEISYLVKGSSFLSNENDAKSLDSVFLHDSLNDNFESSQKLTDNESKWLNINKTPAGIEQEIKSSIEIKQNTKSLINDNTDTKSANILDKKNINLDKTKIDQNTSMIFKLAPNENFRPNTCVKKNEPLKELLNFASTSLVKKNIEHFEKLNKLSDRQK